MDKYTLVTLLKVLPDDATEITTPHLDSHELLFSSDAINIDNAKRINASPAQRGTYRGSKRRWRISIPKMVVSNPNPSISPSIPNAAQPQGGQRTDDDSEGTPINVASLPEVE